MKLNLVFNASSGGFSARANGFLFVLARGFDAKDYPNDQEWMIISRLGNHPKGWIVEPVTDQHILVKHDGFEMSGSMCCTTAYVPSMKRSITPGRLNNIVRTADNVNIGWHYPIFADELHKFDPAKIRMNDNPDSPVKAHITLEEKPTVPGQCYVKRGETRLAGVPDMTDLPTGDVR